MARAKATRQRSAGWCARSAPARRQRLWARICLALFAVGASVVAYAHEAGLSSMATSRVGDELRIEVQFNAQDVPITVRDATAPSLVTAFGDGEPLTLRRVLPLPTVPGQAAWEVRFALSSQVEQVSLVSTVLGTLPPGHRQLVIGGDGASQVLLAILDRRRPTTVLDVDALTQPRTLGVTLIETLGDGIIHIWGGWDHLAFLIVLLLPWLLRWSRAERRHSAVAIVRLVTTFSVAHSCTLIAAALGVVSLPGHWVESSIALSVLVAAAANLRAPKAAMGLMLAFGFGLLHGFGFAGALGQLGLSGWSQVGSLIAFNVGVEVGQLVVVAGVLLIASLPWARWGLPTTHTTWRRLGLVVPSSLVALVAVGWLVERAFLIAAPG